MPTSLSERSSSLRGAAPAIVVYAIVALFAGFIFLTYPHMVEARKKEQALLAEAIAAETMAFCEKRGFSTSAQEHIACAQDLNDLRAKDERRIYESFSGGIL
jgi:hypothetical protein